jgi:hypothetical protein
MRLVARKHESSWLEDGVVVEGHVVERGIYGHAAAELHFLVRSEDGSQGTLVTSLRAYAGRRERSRFRRLAARRAELDHPAAIPIRAVAEYADHPVLIADEYPTRTFADLLKEAAPLPPERVVKMLAPVAEALDLAHSIGLMHDALSADSLLLAERDRLMLDTFGLLASEDEAAWSIIEAGDIGYRSPEQVRAEPIGPWSNIYSLTALLVHALTGEPPYRGDRAAVIYSHLAGTPPRLSDRIPELGGEIDAVVEQGLARAPLDRPASATELLRAAADALRLRRPDRGKAPAPRPRLELVPDGGFSPSVPAGGRPRGPVVGDSPAETRSRREGRRVLAGVVAVALACGALVAVSATPFGDDGPGVAARSSGAAAWKQLVAERAGLRAELASATTPQAQARAASALADLYESAARTGQPRALAAAASDADVAYVRLAAAADRNDRAGYVDAGRAVEDAERRLSLAASRH